MSRLFDELGNDQIDVLRRFAESGKNGERLSLYNGAAQDLTAKGVLIAHPQPQAPNGIVFNLTPLAAKLVHGGYLQQVALRRSQDAAKRTE